MLYSVGMQWERRVKLCCAGLQQLMLVMLCSAGLQQLMLVMLCSASLQQEPLKRLDQLHYLEPFAIQCHGAQTSVVHLL
jgi:hypothetical protein